MGERDGEGHHLGGLVGSVTEHDTLVTGTVALEVTVVETLGNVGRLLLNGDEDVAGLVVEALVRVVVANVLDGVTDDLLVVDLSAGRDLTEDLGLGWFWVKGVRCGASPAQRHRPTMIIPVLVAVSQATFEKGSWDKYSDGLCQDGRGTDLSETGIEDGVRDLVGNLVGVALTDRLGGEEEAGVSVVR